MPVYEYICDHCLHEFEEFSRTMDGSKEQVCPNCGTDRTTRKFSAFAARQGGSSAVNSMPIGGACGRCGDPNGPCGF